MTSLSELGKIIAPIADELGLQRVIVFGSYARGDQTEKSDVDLIIDSGGVLKSGNFFGAVYELTQAIPLKADIFELLEIKKPSQTYDAIMREGVVIYER